jgi:outer membrane protein assembly factor BamD (BamD/ComL family)
MLSLEKTMKRLLMLLFLAVNLLFAGCTGDQGKGLFETAQFEEKQHNLPHALQLYEEIVKKHPSSEFARKAGVRLEELKKEKGLR